MSALDGNRDAALHGHGDTHGHGSRRGFALSALLTAVPLWPVTSGLLASAQATALTIIARADRTDRQRPLCAHHRRRDAGAGRESRPNRADAGVGDLRRDPAIDNIGLVPPGS